MSMTWGDVLADPSLQNLPYKIELSKQGKIEMSHAGSRDALMQAKIIAELATRPGGLPLGECGVQTSDGVRVPDAMWASDAYLASGLADPLATAPEICVEVVSPGNSLDELTVKTRLYLEAGANEVWLVYLDGRRVVHRTATP